MEDLLEWSAEPYDAPFPVVSLEEPPYQLVSEMRQPESGLLLLRGLAGQTLGPAGWRRQVVAAPQFHDNHVFSATVAFNLLMGRCWPPRPEDVQEAEALCCALGLGDLLDRMPAVLLQLVGETGWQLSHGERSRRYIGRALLQGEVVEDLFGHTDTEVVASAPDDRIQPVHQGHRG